MMWRAATRRSSTAIREQVRPPGALALSPRRELRRRGRLRPLEVQLGPFGLDSEFHFPLMWALRGAIARRDRSRSSAIDAVVEAGTRDWAGFGRDDVDDDRQPRRRSLCDRELRRRRRGRLDPAVQPPPGSDVYAKQVLALGASSGFRARRSSTTATRSRWSGTCDPDSRHVMPADSALNSAQSRRAAAPKPSDALGVLCRLRRGTYRLLFANNESLAFARELAGADTAVAVLFSEYEYGQALVPLRPLPAGTVG